MSDGRRAISGRVYGAVIRMHPAEFREEFGREMRLDFEDAVAARGFAPLLGDALVSVARQWKARLLMGGEVEQAVAGHPFLAGQYCMVRQGSSLTVFDLVRASLLSVLLFLVVGFAANVPNKHAVGTPEQMQVSHGGADDAGQSLAAPAAADRARRVASGGWEPEAGPGDEATGMQQPGRVRLRSRGWGNPRIRRHAFGGPPVGTLSGMIWQLMLISGIVWLTAVLLRRAVGTGARLALAVLGLLGVAASAAFGAVPVPAVHAQILHASGALPSFEVATVKPLDRNAGFNMTPPGSQSLMRYAGAARTLVARAYNVAMTPQLVVGGPDWMDDRAKSYVVEGKIPADQFARMQTMSGAERGKQAALMLQALLAERFKLKVHFETREIPVYELTVAKEGAKLPPPNEAGTVAGSGQQAQEMVGSQQVTKDGLAIRNMTLNDMLMVPWFNLDRPIVNMTGLTGTYNLLLRDWTPGGIRMQGTTLVGPPVDQASIFTVLKEQFGLKLSAGKAATEVVVIDSIEPPSAN